MFMSGSPLHACDMYKSSIDCHVIVSCFVCVLGLPIILYNTLCNNMIIITNYNSPSLNHKTLHNKCFLQQLGQHLKQFNIQLKRYKIIDRLVTSEVELSINIIMHIIDGPHC